MPSCRAAVANSWLSAISGLGFASRAATAQAQAEATKARQRPGIEHTKGRADSPYLGLKPASTRAQFTAVRDMLAKGSTNMAQIAKATGFETADCVPAQGGPCRGGSDSSRTGAVKLTYERPDVSQLRYTLRGLPARTVRQSLTHRR
jgi:putative DNA-invertase from lambdoid prophage Rac